MTECYAFGIGGMPNPILHPRQAKQVSDFLNSLDGMLGIHLVDRYHTLLAFETLNQAKIARNRIKAEGNPVGDHIMTAEISEDRQTITVKEPVE